ncbi:MAG: glycosyltransferase family 4 protein [Campylobacterota bacterium]|nr:glycosyltransferase family 4 protein [Campylobacterota bacterium]
MKKSDQKTVAIVINTSWNIFNFRLGVLHALQTDGYKIVCIAPRDAYSEKLESLGFEYHNININNKGTNPLEDAKLVYAFYKLYKEISPDVLLQYTIKPNIYGSMAAGILGIPVISNISGLGTVFLNDSLSSKVAKWLYRVALKVPKKVFYQNREDRALFVESKLVQASKTDLLPGSGIDTEKFKPVSNTDNERVTFLFIARLVKDKGLIEYVEAAKKIKHHHVAFQILGAFYPGNPTAITEDEMKRWEDEGIITYLGTSDAVQSLIAKSDCVVLPSYREGLSRVLLEAASMAKPIIATDVPGCKEVVDDGVNGYLCLPRDSDSLAKEMQKILSLSKDERKKMGQRGREKIVKEFDESIVIEKYRTAIQTLCR